MNDVRDGTTGMTTLTDEYYDSITAMLKELVASQRDKLTQVLPTFRRRTGCFQATGIQFHGEGCDDGRTTR